MPTVVARAHTLVERRRRHGGAARLRSMALSSERRAELYLVDPASNHMLVSKIKPCMSKYKPCTRRDCGRLIKSVMTPLGTDSPVDNVR